MGNKDYNVDDILSEIKSRKIREKSEKPAVAPKPVDEEFHFDFSARGPSVPTYSPPPTPPPMQEPDFSDFPDYSGNEAGGFNFHPDADEKPHNPLEFGGHVRPISEKAKIRGGRRGMRPPLQRFEFNPEAEEPEAPSAPASDMHGNTRVLPKITARDLSTGDIRGIDFEKASIEQSSGPYYDDEDNYADNIREGSVVDYSEYNSESDRRDVQTDIARVKLWLFIRVALTFVLTAALLVFALSGKYEAIPLPEMLWPVSETMRAYLVACTFLTILVALVNSSSIGGGLIGLFKAHANSDTLVSFAVLAAVGQGVAVVANPETAHPEELNLYFFVAALAMLFNGFGKMTMINRILMNFRIISSNKPKKALLAVDSDEFCHEFIKDSARRPTIAYSVKAGFFTDFLALSYSDKYDVGINRAVAPVCLAGSLVVCASTYFLTNSSLSAISALTAILCVCSTLSSSFIENVPLSKLTKKLAPQGGMVSGNKAVEDFCDTRAVILSEHDMFPPGNVKLHGIRAFSQSRIDEAILDAASVLCAMDGALGPVFLDMIGGNRKLLKKVDSIVFENGMGISAWVDSRRVLIGNRRLMLNHGIMLPPEAMQQKQPQITTEAEPLFLSNSGEASAQFTVSYHIDEELAAELDKLALREKLLIIHTTDANITAEKIWELYGYPVELIRVLPAEWNARFQKMSEPRDRAVAEIVYTGHASTMVKAIIACMTARASILSATVIQLIQIVVGYGLVAFMAFIGSIGSFTVTQICAYQFFWFFAIFIIQKIRQS